MLGTKRPDRHALLLFTSLMSAPAVTPFLPRERVRSSAPGRPDPTPRIMSPIGSP